jgi:hypothetical protein
MTKSAGDAEDQAPDYLSFLLRLWRMQGQGADSWRVSVASPGNGERHGFSSLDEFFAFLRRQTGARSSTGDREDRRQRI